MRQKIFVMVGWLHIDKEVVFEVFNKEFEDCKCWFISKDHYLQKKFDYWNYTNNKIAAIFVGPVPHKTFAAGANASMISEVIIDNSPTPVFVCRSKAGLLKFTKTSLQKSISDYKKYIKNKSDMDENIINQGKKFGIMFRTFLFCIIYQFFFVFVKLICCLNYNFFAIFCFCLYNGLSLYLFIIIDYG